MDKEIPKGNTDLKILVDHEMACENVLRLAARRGLKTEICRGETDSIIIVRKA
jgi:hypothetical protein